jgi:hypothetical protein
MMNHLLRDRKRLCLLVLTLWLSTCNLPGGQAPHAATPAPGATEVLLPTPVFPPGAPGAPRLLFTDIESGPGGGGEGGLGVFITLYGEGFGAAQGSGSVTLGGQAVARVVSWGENNAPRSLDKIVIQPGPAAVSGDLVVTTADGASNPLAFNIRPGGIHFVATWGEDAGGGSFEQPWRTITFAKDSMAPGDTVYVMDGVAQVEEDNHSAALALETSGTPGAPRALIAYPGAVASIGSTSLEFGIRVPNLGISASDWVIAGFVLRGLVQAVDIGGAGSSRWRVVGNDISCPLGDGQTGCFAAALASHIRLLGNEVHGISQAGAQPSKQYHAVYFTTDSNHIEVGWNHIHDNRTCRALQFHSSPLDEGTGFNQYDLLVHDNLIHGDACDGINLATVDPSQGAVRVFNNIIFSVGQGPTPPDGDANYTCIYVAGSTNNGGDGSGMVEIFNNTLFDCGRAGALPADNPDRGAFGRGEGSPGLMMALTNNLVLLTPDEFYISPSSDEALITGSNNLWYGGQDLPDFLAGTLEGDALFLDLAAHDLHLQAGSPAIDAGVDAGLAFDFDFQPRPQGSACDIGAYEFSPAP